AATGLGTQERIFMNGEEGGATGFQLATVVTGPDAGKAYILGKFNLNTNGSGVNAVGAWENSLANPFAQDKTVVIANSDGGTTTLSATLTDSDTSAGVAGKVVSFTLGGQFIGTATTDSHGVATIPNVSIAGYAAGTYVGEIKASFNGDVSTLKAAG